MKISTKGRYALRLMLDLAERYEEDGYITIKSIAERQEISNKYLEQIIISLSRAGFVRSARGAQGGYKLARNPEEYTVGMILRQIEGKMVPVSCMEDEPNQCGRAEDCVTLEIWEQLSVAINDVIDNITLEHLLEKQRAKPDGVYCKK
ncbi:MAG: RrF2 family transcriptional regulator [Christensenellales bacterium]|jgi:Rrf2 family protein